MLFVEDLVDAFLLAQANIHTLSGQAFNIGGGLGNTISLLELLEIDRRAARREAGGPDSKDWRPGRPALLRVGHAAIQGGDGLGAQGQRARRACERLYQWLLESRGCRRRSWRLPAEDCMRYSLINPPWSFEGSIYFGCREPHLPLEYGYSKALLEAAGHEVADRRRAAGRTVARRRRDGASAAFRPDFTVVTTAPSYLFWRCAPPELRVPLETCGAMRDVGGQAGRRGPARLDHARGGAAQAGRRRRGDRRVRRDCCRDWPALGAVTRSCYRRTATRGAAARTRPT